MMTAPVLDHVLVTTAEAVATVSLNRPEQYNPLSAGMQRDLTAALQWASHEPTVRVIVLTGAGTKAFSAGADLQSLRSESEMSELEKYQSRELFRELLVSTEKLGKPLIGRINGHAIAGGFGLACTCDILVAADSATFGTSEINVGLWPMMLQPLMMRNLPRKLALRMMMLGERFSAQQMQQAGFISEVVPYGDLDAAVASITGRLATKSSLILRLGRDSFYSQQDMHMPEVLAYLQSSLSLVSMSNDAQEGIAAFLEKRRPDFKGS